MHLPLVRRSPEEIVDRAASILSAEDLADLLELNLNLLRSVERRRRSLYKEFTIEKRSGSSRAIHAPAPDLRAVQRRMKYIFDQLFIAPSPAHGFVSKRSIVTNARRHESRRYVLNLDLVDFFPNVTWPRVYGVLGKPPFSFGSSAAALAANLCCLVEEDGHGLPQGAPTSPVLSNVVARNALDRPLLKLARQHHLMYTRYADDVTLSTGRETFPPEIAVQIGQSAQVHLGEELLEVLDASGFKVHTSKLRMQSGRQHKEVTGLTVNGRANVHRSVVRTTRAMLHAWRAFGPEAAGDHHKNKYGGRTLDIVRVIRGYLDFIEMVRGRSPVVLNLNRQFSDLVNRDLRESKSYAWAANYVDKMRPNRRFDVAISYASEDKPVAEAIASELRDRYQLEVFFDDFHAVEIWGTQLPEYFQTVFEHGSMFCVIVMSEHYIGKMWTNVERRFAVSRAVRELGQEYILPIRTDSVDAIPGLPAATAYRDLGDDGVDGVSKLISEKVAGARGREKSS